MRWDQTEQGRAYHKKYNEDNRGKINSYQRKYWETHKEECLARSKKYSEKNKEKMKKVNRRGWMLREYGLTEEAFNSMLEGQGCVCSICGKDDWGTQGPHIDHDHETGAVRGILCHYCNSGLGMFRDNIESLANAIDYLSGK